MFLYWLHTSMTIKYTNSIHDFAKNEHLTFYCWFSFHFGQVHHTFTTLEQQTVKKSNLLFTLRDVCTGERRGCCPPALIHRGREGQEFLFILNSFSSLLSSEGEFSGIVDSLFQENFSGSKPPDLQICVVLLEDQCTKPCSLGTE